MDSTSGFMPYWFPAEVTSLYENYKTSHRIGFKSSEFFDSREFIAMRMSEVQQELKVGDYVMIFNANPSLNNMFFFMPILKDGYNKIEMFSGVKSDGKEKTNHIDLTHAGEDGDNTTKEIYIKSDNKITIESGNNLIVIDGKTGTIDVSARSIEGTGSDITFTGNINVNGDVTVSGDVKSGGGMWSLMMHQHFGNLALPTTPPFPSGTLDVITV